MRSDKLRKLLLATLASFTTVLLAAPALLAQSTPPDAPGVSVSASAAVVASSRLSDIFPSAVSAVSSSGSPAISPELVTSPSSAPEQPRRFFDKWNLGLFTGSAALDSADFAVTRSNLQSNGKEYNPIVRVFGRSTAGLALNFAGEAVGTVGLSYFFHKTGHYKLERAVSMVNISATGFAVSYSASHR
jgi:hypothetical protein